MTVARSERTNLRRRAFSRVRPSKIPWNIEVKNGTGWEEALPRLFTILDRQVTARRIAVVVAGGKNTARVHQAIGRSPHGQLYATNVPASEQLRDRMVGVFMAGGKPLRRRAVQTSYSVVTPGLVRDVHARGGALHVFLTPFWPTRGIDHLPMHDLRRRVFDLLDIGVDGLMTDYPARVVQIVREWKEGRDQ